MRTTYVRRSGIVSLCVYLGVVVMVVASAKAALHYDLPHHPAHTQSVKNRAVCIMPRLSGYSLRTPSVTRWMFLISACVVFVRVFVLFCESYSQVNSERLSDNQLLELCSRGAAAESTKFRQLCLQTKAERAAPLVFKAVLKAVRTTFCDFTDSVNSPTKIALLLLFCLSGLALPVVKAMSSLATAYLGPNALERVQGLHLHEDDEQEACEVVVLNGPRGKSWASSLARNVPGRRRLTLSSMEEKDEDQHEWSRVCLGTEQA